MKYIELDPISREEVELALHGEEADAARGILRMALNDPDWRWAEKKCLASLYDDRDAVKSAAIIGLGHLARIHGKITKETVLPELHRLQSHEKFGGIVEDALEDIYHFAAGSL